MSEDNVSAQIGQFVNIPQGGNIQKVKDAFDEISDAKAFIAAKQSVIKDIKAMLKEDYDMTPKSITAIIKLNSMDTPENQFEESEEIQALFETLFGNT